MHKSFSPGYILSEVLNAFTFAAWLSATTPRTLKPQLANAAMQVSISLASYSPFSAVIGQPLTTTGTEYLSS